MSEKDRTDEIDDSIAWIGNHIQENCQHHIRLETMRIEALGDDRK